MDYSSAFAASCCFVEAAFIIYTGFWEGTTRAELSLYAAGGFGFIALGIWILL